MLIARTFVASSLALKQCFKECKYVSDQCKGCLMPQNCEFASLLFNYSLKT